MDGSRNCGSFSVSFTQALHSSSTIVNGQSIYLGNPNGVVIKPKDGPGIYHMGDTDLFSDMALIAEIYAPKIGLVPVGDRFTMSPREAAYACNLLKPKSVIPMHFGTFPLLTGTPGQLQKLAPDVDVVELKPGVTVS